MKKYLLSLATFVVSSLAIAQIPNASFENWTSMGSYNNPDNWDNLNAMTSGMGVYTCTKGTPGSPGAAYLKLVSKSVSGMGVMPGMATTGVISMANLSVTGGFPFTQRPQSLTGSWQFMASGSDAGFVAVYLSRWNNMTNMRDTVAMAVHNLSGMVMSWTNFTINLTYNNANNPDTAQIILSASGITPVANSYLYADNLAFAGSVTGITDVNNTVGKLSVYPNPANNQVTVDLELENNSSVKLQLVDVTGKTVKELNETDLSGRTRRNMEVADLSKGIYFLKASTEYTSEVRKIIIE